MSASAASLAVVFAFVMAGCGDEPSLGALGLAGAAIDFCRTDAECVLVREDACCLASPCDQHLRAETPARTRARHADCARKDCASAPRPDCRVADRRVVARCERGACIVAIP